MDFRFYSKTRSNKSSIIYFWRMSEELSGPVNISLPFLKVMTRALEEDRRSVLTMAVANCLSSILRLNPKPVTVYKIEVVVPLTVALIRSFLHCITSSATGNRDHCSDRMGQTVADLLHHLSYLQSVYGNTKKLPPLQGLPLISPVITSPDVWKRIASSIVHFTKTQTQSSNRVGMRSVDTATKTVDDLLVSSLYIEIRSLHTQEALFQAGQMWPKMFFRVMRQHLITSSSADIGPLVDSLEELLGRTREERLPTDREARKLTKFLSFVPCCLEEAV